MSFGTCHRLLHTNFALRSIFKLCEAECPNSGRDAGRTGKKVERSSRNSGNLLKASMTVQRR
ncbi:unnamed protein product, partial [Nesidiocoris tenuis]